MASSRDRTLGHRPSRREFLRTTAASAAAMAVGRGLRAAETRPEVSDPAAPGSVTKLSDHLSVFHGPVNVGIVRDGERALLIDCGAGDIAAALNQQGITKVEQILFTHYHRDQLCGAYGLGEGARIGVPAVEREHFADPAAYWEDDKYLWMVYRSFRPHHLMPVEPLRVDDALKDGDRLEFGPAKLRVLSTPGHTEGSASYLVEVDGRRVVFSGDCIYGPGQVWDVYSVQKGFSRGGRSIGGYHGFMGDRWRLVESLGRIKGEKPDLLVPSHGNLMKEPAGAIDALAERFETCYENYVAISALRHYFPELFTDYAGRPGQMPIRPGIEPPGCLRHFGTTWMLVSKTGAALVMDVGSPGIVERIKKMLADGEIKSVDALWVTHYHFDHTAGIPAFQKEFDCPTIAQKSLAEVLIEPTAWRLPCLMAEPVRVERPVEDGHSWPWHEFRLTAYDFPGQTLYHDALLAETGELKMLFVGDSHTMSGIDDYCAYNRNWLGRGVGFQYCLDRIEKLGPTHVFNCHVDKAFTFTPEEVRFMRRNLDERERLFGELVPWDHANYGLDASWVRCDPYTEKVRPGEQLGIDVVITNHSAAAQPCACRAVLPKSFGGGAEPWVESEAPAKTEHRLALKLTIPAGLAPGRLVIPVDVKHGSWHLPQFAEAIVDVVA